MGHQNAKKKKKIIYSETLHKTEFLQKNFDSMTP